MKAVGLAILVSLALAGPAEAAFAPAFQVRLDPPAPRAKPVITATVSQAAGETAPQRISLAFPIGFGLRVPRGVPACRAAAQTAGTCPRATELGSLELLAATGEKLSGPVSLARVEGGEGIVAMLPGLSLSGPVRMAASGGPNVTLDGFGPTPLRSLTLRLTGGDRGLVQTPRTCANYLVQARATSQLGEMAIGMAAVNVRGCRAAHKKRHS